MGQSCEFQVEAVGARPRPPPAPPGMKLVITGVAAGGPGAARAHCRFVLPLIRFILDSLTYSVPLFLKGQCDRTLGAAAGLRVGDEVLAGEKQIRGSGGSLEPPGPLPMHLHTVYMEYSECLPTQLLNPAPYAVRLSPG